MPSENPNAPRENTSKTVSPKDATGKEKPKVDGGSAVPSKTVPSPEAHDNPCKCRYEPTPWWMRALEGLGIFSAIVYAAITWCMWRDSHNNFILGERAWISFDKLVLPSESDIKEDATLTSSFLIKNTGKTPARRAAGAWAIMVQRANEPIQFSYQNAYMSLAAALPSDYPWENKVSRMKDSFNPQTLTKDEVADLLSGRSYVVLYGVVLYRDAFGSDHWLQMCGYAAFFKRSSVNAIPCVAYNDFGDGLPPGMPPLSVLSKAKQ